MIARRPSSPRVVSGLLVALIVAGWIGTPGVRAVEPPGAGPLDRPLVDVALVQPGDGLDAPPFLLTLETAGFPQGAVRIALLDRSIDWLPMAEGTVALPGDGAETPWLVDLGGGRFVVLSTSHDEGQTALLRVDVQPDAEPPIAIGPMTRLAMAVDDAGAIDVDGDGSTELVVASATTTRGGGTCQSSEIRVLDGTGLHEVAHYPIPDLRLAGGVLGEWDGEPGGDLLAYTYGNCPAGPIRPNGSASSRSAFVTARRRSSSLPETRAAPCLSRASPWQPISTATGATRR